MNRPKTYTDCQGNTFSLSALDADELALIDELQKFAAEKPEWTVFRNRYTPTLANFYEPRGLTRRQITETLPWRIAQDLASRIGLAEGWMRPGDYRDELETLIRTQF